MGKQLERAMLFQLFFLTLLFHHSGFGCASAGINLANNALTVSTDIFLKKKERRKKTKLKYE